MFLSDGLTCRDDVRGVVCAPGGTRLGQEYGVLVVLGLRRRGRSRPLGAKLGVVIRDS